MKRNILSKTLKAIFFSFVLSFFYVYYLDNEMRKTLEPYINTEIERLTSNIVHRAIREKMKNQKVESFLLLNNNPNSSEKTVSYDIKKINLLKDEITDMVQNILQHLDESTIEDYQLFSQLRIGKFQNIKKGILIEKSINSLRKSIIFGNIGPKVPIRLFLASQVYSEIDVKSKEYGINNILVEIYLVITIKEQTTMPLASALKEIKIKEMIGVDIIRGVIPNNYTGHSK